MDRGAKEGMAAVLEVEVKEDKEVTVDKRDMVVDQVALFMEVPLVQGAAVEVKEGLEVVVVREALPDPVEDLFKVVLSKEDSYKAKMELQEHLASLEPPVHPALLAHLESQALTQLSPTANMVLKAVSIQDLETLQWACSHHYDLSHRIRISTSPSLSTQSF